MSAMTVRTVQGKGSKKHEFIIFVHLFAVLGKHFFLNLNLKAVAINLALATIS